MLPSDSQGERLDGMHLDFTINAGQLVIAVLLFRFYGAWRVLLVEHQQMYKKCFHEKTSACDALENCEVGE